MSTTYFTYTHKITLKKTNILSSLNRCKNVQILSFLHWSNVYKIITWLYLDFYQKYNNYELSNFLE